MSPRAAGRFYYDIISPFTYLFLKMRAPLIKKVDLTPVPIFFPELIRLHGSARPAKIPDKRRFSFASCVWRAKKLNVPLTFPKRHPFSSIHAQRLLLQENADWATIDRAFDFVWAQGNDPESQYGDFCDAVGLPRSTPLPSDKAVKDTLLQNTKDAAAAGVFGVPSVEVNGRVFWGCDHLEWLLDFVDNPEMFNDPAYAAAWATENPL
ncbi:hypothetical protein As57867_023808, partial [Aphanomyces stellatus]